MDAIHHTRCVSTRKLRGSEKPRDAPNKPGGLYHVLDQKAAGFAGRTAGRQEPPDARWAHDSVHEWVADLMSARAMAPITAGVEASIRGAQQGRK